MGNFRLGPTALVCLTLCAVASLAIVKNWRLGVLFLFLWLPFEDYIRKSAGNDLSIFFVKDLLLAATYASALLSRREGANLVAFRNPALLPLALWAALSLAEIFNPRGGGITTGIVGFRMSFIYVPLLLLGARAFRSDRELIRFGIPFLLVVIIVCCGGLIQLVLGPHYLNPATYAEQMEVEFLGRGTAEYGRFTYLTSFFNNTARYGRFLTAAVAVSGGFFAYAHVTGRIGLRRLAGAAFLLTSLSLMLNGSRTIFLCLLAFAIGFAVLSARGKPRALLRNLSAVTGVLLGAALLLWVINPDSTRAIFGFYYVTLSPGSSGFEITGRIRDYGGITLPYAIEKSGLIGHGSGTASSGAQYVENLNDPWNRHMTEGGYAGILWEHGVIGFALFLWIAGALLRTQYRETKALEGGRWQPLGIALFLWSALFLGPLTFMGMQVYQDFVPNSLFWFWSGALFGLRNLKEEEAEEAPAAGSMEGARLLQAGTGPGKS